MSASDLSTPLAACRQVVLVLADDWTASRGMLSRHVRDADGAWVQQGEAWPVRLGRAGLAWGIGCHPPPGASCKQEGDGRAPAGVFRLSAAFGEAPAGDGFVRTLRLPYQPTDSHWLCVDDPDSASYNGLVDRRQVAVDWQSAEALQRSDGRYTWGVLIDHNPPPAQPGAGSCIFVHVWGGPEVPTAGCTALDGGHLQTLLAWLDAAANPCLVQLPAAEYASRRADWDLPDWPGRP